MDKLKPCPFCGKGNAILDLWPIESIGISRTEYSVKCQDCGALGPNELRISGAVKVWNLRRWVEEEEATT